MEQVFCHRCGARQEVPPQEDERLEQLRQELRQRDAAIAALQEQLEQAGGTGPARKGAGKLWIAASVVLLAAFVCAAVIAVIKSNAAADYRDSYYSASSRCSALEQETEDLVRQADALAQENEGLAQQVQASAEQTEFMDRYIGIIDMNSGDMLYHTYGCPVWDWDGDWTIRAYNIAAAENAGYTPCPQCHG